MDEITIRLDKSKPYSECRGDREPDDPHYRVHFFQDSLPFDVAGKLIPDDKKTESWIAMRDNGDGTQSKVIHRPLYNADMRDVVARKIERLPPRPDAAPKPKRDQATDDVNLEAWMRGEADYAPAQIFATMKERRFKVYTRLANVVADLIDEGLVAEDNVAPALVQLLDQAAA